MSATLWSQRHRDLLRAVADDRVACDMTRGAWVRSDHKRRMGCYRWVGGDRMSLRDIEALVELRQGEQIVTVPVAGTDVWPVRPTVHAEALLVEWEMRRGARS